MSYLVRPFYLFSSIFRFFGVFGLQIMAVRFLGIDEFGKLTTLLAAPLFIATFISMVGAESMVQALKNIKKPTLSIGIPYFKSILYKEIRLFIFFIPILILIFLIIFILKLNTDSLYILFLSLTLLVLSFIGSQSIQTMLLISNKILFLSYIFILETFLILTFYYFFKSLDFIGYIFAITFKNVFLTLICIMKSGLLSNKNYSLPFIENKNFQKRSLLIKAGWTNLDILAVAAFSPLAIVAEYRICKSLSGIIGILVSPYWNLLKPDIIKEFADGSLNNIYLIIKKSALVITFAGIFIILILLYFLDAAVLFLYDHNLSDSGFYIFFTISFATLFSVGTTGWSRFIQNLSKNFMISYICNIFNLLTLGFSIPIFVVFGILVPYTISFGMIVVAIVYWYWFLNYFLISNKT